MVKITVTQNPEKHFIVDARKTNANPSKTPSKIEPKIEPKIEVNKVNTIAKSKKNVVLDAMESFGCNFVNRAKIEDGKVEAHCARTDTFWQKCYGQDVTISPEAFRDFMELQAMARYNKSSMKELADEAQKAGKPRVFACDPSMKQWGVRSRSGDLRVVKNHKAFAKVVLGWKELPPELAAKVKKRQEAFMKAAKNPETLKKVEVEAPKVETVPAKEEAKNPETVKTLEALQKELDDLKALAATKRSMEAEIAQLRAELGL